ncbi:hypothetical protein DFP75_101639 [Marinomonas alcarazii]|uniref:Uncharacterized protein n=1 Tax=Marinomonas alcarazii TaxID=491949 RepID=A0A318V9W6_9GAMM|nr:hypothetical protein [Marinomonas alcarazii]PYF84601.1 hypothetical protein DFP75_101639 [Marinomonas alcarazii]
MYKKAFFFSLIFLLSLAFSSGDEKAFRILESNAPGILGAILGGIIGGISIIFSVIITISSSTNKRVFFNSLNGFLRELKTDIFVLLMCLMASLLLPYLRVRGVPLLNYPKHELIPNRDIFYTTLEIASIIISLAIILEIFNIIFMLLSHFLTKVENEKDCSTTEDKT